MFDLPKKKKELKCRDCGKWLTKYNQYPSCKRRKQYVCKKCWNNRFYLSVRKYRYGLTKEDILALLKKQRNKCPVCKENLTEVFEVDHDHINLKVRGLLCRKCNWGIGLLRDSIPILKSAIKYMRRRRQDVKTSDR